VTTRGRKILGMSLAVFATFCSKVAIAQSVTAVELPPTLGSPSAEQRSLDLVVGKALLFRLPVKASDVIVAEPGIADVVIRSPELVYMLGRQSGVTNMMFLDEQQRVIHDLEVVVRQDLEELRHAVKSLYPDVLVNLASVRNNIVITGDVRSARVSEDVRLLAQRFVAAPENVINRLRILGEQQVMLRVRIAEVRRTIVKQLGISGVIGGSPTVQAIGPTFTTPLTSSGVAGPTGANSIFRFGLLPGRPFNNAALALDVLESEGLVKTLAEPNLTALSGEGASFLAGGEIPVPAGVDRPPAGGVSTRVHIPPRARRPRIMTTRG
jgi:pilus assembly protein CpaC